MTGAEFELSEAERRTLEDLTRGSSRLAVRASIVLACARPGVVYRRLAADLGVTRMTVVKWRKRFQEAGVDGLVDGERPGRPAGTTVVLSELERRRLRRWAESAQVSRQLALRARIVLACELGASNKAVAEQLGVTTHTVIRWRQRYVGRGLAGLRDEPRPGRPRRR